MARQGEAHNPLRLVFQTIAQFAAHCAHARASGWAVCAIRARPRKYPYPPRTDLFGGRRCALIDKWLDWQSPRP